MSSSKTLVTNNPEFLTFPNDRPLVKHPPTLPTPRVLAKSPDTVTVDLPKASVKHYLENLPELLNSAFAAPRYREGKDGQKRSTVSKSAGSGKAASLNSSPLRTATSFWR